MDSNSTRMTTDMGWDMEDGLWSFTLLTEPSLSAELSRLSGAKKVGDTDIVSFQPCPNPDQASQDRYAIEDWPLSNGTWSLRAVFDGHAGCEVAELASERLPGLIQTALVDILAETNSPTVDRIAEALKDTIAQFDANLGKALLDLFPDESKLASMTNKEICDIINDEGPNYVAVRRCTRGTTVLVALVDPGKSNLWVASLGDCVAVLGSKKADEWIATVVSVPHNGEAPSEAERIKREHPNEPDVMLDDRVLGSIAVTRAIGDFSYKLPAIYTQQVFLNLRSGYEDVMRVKVHNFIHRNTTPPYMSGVPDVTHVNLRDEGVTDAFIILCSDGLVDLHDERLEVDKILSKRWVKTLGPQLSNKDDNMALKLLREGLGGADIEKVSSMITVEMTERWMDDTTIIVQRLFC